MTRSGHVSVKLDENVPEAVRDRFRRSGFDTATAQEQGLAGQPDEVLWEVCAEERRMLVTLDLDFADLRARPRTGDAGVVVLRPRHQTVRAVDSAIELVIGRLCRDRRSVDNELWIASDHAVRVRRREAG